MNYKYKAKIVIEGSSMPIEVETEAMNINQATKIIDGKYKIKRWVRHPYINTKK